MNTSQKKKKRRTYVRKAPWEKPLKKPKIKGKWEWTCPHCTGTYTNYETHMNDSCPKRWHLLAEDIEQFLLMEAKCIKVMITFSHI